ncbi:MULTISPECIES: cytochrome c-type biogenesis protein [unclassified Pseudonocardia]|uniref:cytochrome c-type biogenesis protein n=1 Tax=unclassified Pseudonocardia TaxID=2619320 RepID=UPI00095CA657|nr:MULTISPECIES: cytochrome c-type biogenesis protein [unclassified Pseudonocardia]MBN9098028.1 cytochrome c-type biogenesis protein CcmH [Pseudonocardia sp.]OJY54426.1 MAG: hypothetical protein BGP03_23110 [Pseudonocardia sp. 73-21]
MPERRWSSVAVAVAVLGLLTISVVTLISAGRPDPDRVQELALQLRCPVCKSVSIAESPSDTATAMRQVVSEQVAAGRSDAEVIGYFRARYGDWVWLDPPARGTTLLLWVLPVGATVAGAALVWARARGRDRPAPAPPAPLDRARVDAAVARARATIHPDGEDGP